MAFVCAFPFKSVHNEWVFLAASCRPAKPSHVRSETLPFGNHPFIYFLFPVIDYCIWQICVNHHSHAVSGALRWRGDVDTLVGEGEAVQDESLPPPSDPAGGGLSCGIRGAFFLLSILASNAPLLLPPSGLESAAPSSIKWVLRCWSPGLSGGLRVSADWVSNDLDPQRSMVEFLLSGSSVLFSPADWCISSSMDPHCPWFSSRVLVRFKLWKSL